MAWLVIALVLALDVVAAERRPNVLLVLTDQHQADALGALGRAGLSTPHLDGLVHLGTAFTRAYVANPRCVPSRSSLFSGHFPHQTGIQENDPELPGGFRTPLLGRHFADAGYATGYFGKFHIPVADSQQAGFAQMAHLRSSGQDEAATKAAAAFLAGVREPFLLVVSYCNPHNICEFGRDEPLPDGPIGRPAALADCPPPVPNPDLPADEADAIVEQRRLRATLAEYRLLEKYSADDWRRYRWAYHRMIEKVDAHIGRVLEALRASGYGGNTLIAFTSDHGETAGAHGFSEKVVFYEESVRVPLILSWPGVIVPGRRDELVNTGIDVLPTLLDFAGVPAPPRLPGRSLRPLTTSAARADWRTYIVSQNLMLARQTRVNGRMVRAARFKYCVYDRGTLRESLFDLVNDPLEMRNLVREPTWTAELARARAMLAEHAREQRDTVAAAILSAASNP